jgi:hypothetical protein
MKTIAFVASTLPVEFLRKNEKKLNIEEIILNHNGIYESYSIFEAKIIKILKPKILSQIFYIAYKLLEIKIRKKRVIFFHECGVPIFDILVKIINPKGDYYPHTNMNGYKKISYEEMRINKLIKLIELIKLKDQFNYYEDLKYADGKKIYTMSMKLYPCNIKINSIVETWEQKKNNSKEYIKSNRILILTGRDYIEDKELKKLLNEIIDFIISIGIICDLKKHPIDGIDIIRNDVNILDSQIPVEIMENIYINIIGVSSTALLHWPKKSISIINLLNKMDEETKKIRKNYLMNLPGSEFINFPNVIDDLHQLIIKNKSYE